MRTILNHAKLYLTSDTGSHINSRTGEVNEQDRIVVNCFMDDYGHHYIVSGDHLWAVEEVPDDLEQFVREATS